MSQPVSGRHRWRFPALVAVLVAATAAGGYFAGDLLDRPPDDGGAIVATVNGHPIHAAYLDQRMGEATPGDQIAMLERRDRFLDSIVTEELLLQSVLSTDFAGEPGLREQVKALVAEHLIRTRIGARIRVEEADAERYYREHQSVIRGETVRVSHIVMRERADCERLMSEIADEASFVAAAREHSIDPATGSRGGTLGRVMDHAGRLGFEQQMFRLGEGEMAVYDGPGGCHLVRAGERELPPVPPYEAVRERVHALLRRQQEIALLRALVEELETRLEVVRY